MRGPLYFHLCDVCLSLLSSPNFQGFSYVLHGTSRGIKGLFHNTQGFSYSQQCFFPHSTRLSHSSIAFHPGSTNLLAGSKPSPISSKAFSIVCRFFHNSHSFPQRIPGFIHRCYTPRLPQWAPRFHPQVLRVMMVHFLTGDRTQDITNSRKVLSH